MPVSKSKRKRKPLRPPLHDLIELRKWEAVEARLSKIQDEASQISKTNGFIPLSAACRQHAPPYIIADLIKAYPKGVCHVHLRNGCTPLHYACSSLVSLDVIKMLVREYPDGKNVKNYKQQLPVDCIAPGTGKHIKEFLNDDGLEEAEEQANVTIEHGVGGARISRQSQKLEKTQMFVQVDVYHVPLSGLSGFVGGLHSLVRVTYTYRGQDHYKVTESVLIERVGVVEEDNNVIFSQEKSLPPNTILFRRITAEEVEMDLSMYRVVEQATEWGKVPYNVANNNCHTLAVDLFNFCVSTKHSHKKIAWHEIPNYFLAKLAGSAPFIASGSIAASGSNSSARVAGSNPYIVSGAAVVSSGGASIILEKMES